MEESPFEPDRIISRLKKLAYLNKNAMFTFIDETQNVTESFHYPDGIITFIERSEVCIINSKRNYQAAEFG